MKHLMHTIFAATLLIMSTLVAAVERREANNGNIVMEDIPEIPTSIVKDLNRYQNVRSAGFRGWTQDGIPTLDTLKRLRIAFPEVVAVVEEATKKEVT